LEQKTPSENGNAKKSSQAWKTLLGLAVMALFLWLAFRRIPLGDFLKTLKEVSLLPVAAVFLIQTAAMVLRGLRWKIMLASSHPSLKNRHAVMATILGYAVNVIIPRGGEFFRAVYLRRIAKTSLVAGLSSVVAERLLDVATMCLLFVLVIPLYQDRLERIFPGVGRGMLILAGIALAGLGVVWALGRKPERSAQRLEGVLEKIWAARAKQFSEIGENFFRGFGGLFVKESAGAMLLLSAGIWFLYILVAWSMFFSFPSGAISQLSLIDAAAVTVVSTIAISIPSPGGTGTMHFFVSQLLIGLYAAGPGEALAYATLYHLSGIVPPLVLGAAVWLLPGAAVAGEAE
jgi:uncharacterized protein (TIRG00374 family)